ncbi:hypothetical protein D9M70_496590 [compost metagenome]
MQAQELRAGYGKNDFIEQGIADAVTPVAATEAHFDVVVGDIDGCGIVDADHLQQDIRIGRIEFAQCRQEPVRCRDTGAQLDHSAFLDHRPQGSSSVLDVVESHRHRIEQPPSCLGELQARTESNEQGNTQGVFELLDLTADRRLRNEELLGCPREIAASGGGLESHEPIHGAQKAA